MSNEEKRKKKLTRLAKVIKGGNIGILEYLFEMEEKMEEMHKELTPDLREILEKIKGKDGNDGLPGEDGKDYLLTTKDKKEIAKAITVPIVEKVIEKTEVVRELPMVLKEVTQQTVENPVTGEEIVKKVNALDIEPELQIDIEHIKGWKDIKDRVDGISRMVSMGGNSARDLFKDYDLSSQLNGVLKTFSIPATWNIISVNLSSFPYGSLRKNTDFTYTSTSITFTDEIDAATQLATGQSCVLTIVTA